MLKIFKIGFIFLIVALLAVLLVAPTLAAAPVRAEALHTAAPAPVINTAAVTSTTAITEGSQGCTTHLQDGANAKVTILANVRGIRYCEISVICGAQASMYNTTTLNNVGNPMDTCDPKLWAGVDETALATQLDVPGVWKNGPRFWTNDVMSIPTGLDNPLDFNGLKAGWFAYPKYPPNIQNLGITAGAYITTTVARSSVMTFTAGSPIFIMDDPNGNPWVMQAAAQIVNPNLTYGDLAFLDTQLHMPEGWSYRVKTIDQDLVIVAVNGFAQITQDDLGNSYDGCIQLDGEPTCNFVP
jgi:hypothetical protein